MLFTDPDGQVIAELSVPDPSNIIFPEAPPAHQGEEFIGWAVIETDDGRVVYQAVYSKPTTQDSTEEIYDQEPEKPASEQHDTDPADNPDSGAENQGSGANSVFSNVVFIDLNGVVLSETSISEDGEITFPENVPEADGKVFIGWAVTETEDGSLMYQAQYADAAETEEDSPQESSVVIEDNEEVSVPEHSEEETDAVPQTDLPKADDEESLSEEDRPLEDCEESQYADPCAPDMPEETACSDEQDESAVHPEYDDSGTQGDADITEDSSEDQYSAPALELTARDASAPDFCSALPEDGESAGNTVLPVSGSDAALPAGTTEMPVPDPSPVSNEKDRKATSQTGIHSEAAEEESG